jgi:hypothetical protein
VRGGGWHGRINVDHADGPARDAPPRGLGVSWTALAQLAAVLEDPLMEAVLYAQGYVDAQVHHSAAVLNLRDTEAGRVVSYRMTAVRGLVQEWMAIAPATPGGDRLGHPGRAGQPADRPVGDAPAHVSSAHRNG